MRGLSRILSLIRQEFNEFNDTGARFIYFIYHMALELIKKSHFWRKNCIILSIECNVKIDVIHVT